MASGRSTAPQQVNALVIPVTVKDCNIHPATAAQREPIFTWLLLWLPDTVQWNTPCSCKQSLQLSSPDVAVHTDAVIGILLPYIQGMFAWLSTSHQIPLHNNTSSLASDSLWKLYQQKFHVFSQVTAKNTEHQAKKTLNALLQLTSPFSWYYHKKHYQYHY